MAGFNASVGEGAGSIPVTSGFFYFDAILHGENECGR